jgi:hypothetical protein
MTQSLPSTAVARPPRFWLGAASVVGASLLIAVLSGGPAAAQQATKASPSAAGASAPSAATPAASKASASHTRPAAARPAGVSGWNALTPAQQQALKPLQANWGTMTEAHQRKWIALSRTYPDMSPPEQARLHSRMTEWATLSPRQRAAARLNFAETKQHSADEKKAKWQAYQALSPEEKQKLAANAKSKPQGAAPAVKPVPTQKLAVVPSDPSSQKKHPTIAGASGKLDQNTLLPHPAPAQADAPTHRN